MSEPTAREPYQQLLRGEIPAHVYADAVKREVREQIKARPYKPRRKRRPWWKFWVPEGENLK